MKFLIMAKNTNNGNSTGNGRVHPQPNNKGTPTGDSRKSIKGNSDKQRSGITDTLKPPPRPDR